MSYALDLDEYTAERLLKELQRREELRSDGKCCYCERPFFIVPSCKFPLRHSPGNGVTPPPVVYDFEEICFSAWEKA